LLTPRLFEIYYLSFDVGRWTFGPTPETFEI